MNKNLKQIAGCLVVLILCAGAVRAMGHFLDPFESEHGFNAIDAFHSLEDNSLEVIVYGSSHAWKGFDTRILNEEYGISAYNYGCHWQALNTTLLFLQDSLTTQTPKVACIETFLVNAIEKNTDLDGQIYYCSEIPFSQDKIKYLTTCFGSDIERYASYFFPLIMFHDNWTGIDSENFSDGGYRQFADNAGYYPLDGVYEGNIPDHTTFEQKELSEDSLNVLDQMVAECKKRNIAVVFYTCPYEGEYNYSDAMKKYAAQNGCVYIDLFENPEETGLNGATDFNDTGHLNTSGSAKVAKYIGNYIISNYDVGD